MTSELEPVTPEPEVLEGPVLDPGYTTGIGDFLRRVRDIRASAYPWTHNNARPFGYVAADGTYYPRAEGGPR